VVLSPSGDIAAQQGHLVVISTVLMLLVVLPVMVLTVLFAWRYRENGGGRYEPEWDHATHLELLIWGAPLLIIIALGALTWAGTHLLDPFRPLARTAAGRPVVAGASTLKIQVVALDWKWLFIYPEQGIATVNELAAPVDTPLEFDITASTVMNDFYVPALAGQIYAMPGMQTQLHAVLNRTGDYPGFSANYSGAGFSGMRFSVKGMAPADFTQWVTRVKAAGGSLDRAGYQQLAAPSENEPVHRFAMVSPDLYHAVLTMCVTPGPGCMDAMDMTHEHPKAAAPATPLRGAGLPAPPMAWFGASAPPLAANQRNPNP
jgi:cytochrome o ubiquinol oxidase subunit 2